jgi:hypothetical protein
MKFHKKKGELTFELMQKAIDEIEAHTVHGCVAWVYFNGRFYTDPDEFLKVYTTYGIKVSKVLKETK